MKEQTIYRSVEGKTKIFALYDEFISRLGIEHDDLYVETRYGSTHIIAIGPKDGAPMIFFHGGNSLNPFDLKKFIPLANKYRIYAPDTIGHPGKSSEHRLSPKDNSYGKWAIDVLDGLKLEHPAFVGPSFGGGILLQIASFAPERISAAVFIVPSGFANGSGLSIIRKLVIPLIKYRISPTRKNFEKTVLPLVDHLDDDLVEMSLLTISNLKVASRMPHPMKTKELLEFKAPTLVIAAENDILFPGESVINRAKEIIPNLINTELLCDKPHAFYTASKECLERVIDLTREFFDSNLNSL